MQQSFDLTPDLQRVRQKYPTYKAFFKDYEPKQLLVQFDEVNTIEQSISKNRISIGDINNIYSTEKNVAVNFVEEWIRFINRTVNVNKPLAEIGPVAYMIYKDNQDLSLADFKIIAERIMRGDYGMFYGSVDAQLILSAFVKYKYEMKQTKIRLQARGQTPNQPKVEENSELERLLKETETRVMLHVNKELNENFPHLSGLQQLKKRAEMMNSMLTTELEKTRKKYHEKTHQSPSQ